MRQYLKDEVEILLRGSLARVVRSGWRSLLDCSAHEFDLTHFLAGQIPYYYREPSKIANEFARRRNALEMVTDLIVKAPTTPKFQQSHCGEILCALYVEQVLGLRRLYSKLTLTSAENTNVHKMDGFFVDLNTSPYTYIAVEAKSSILPTARTAFRGHRHGILKQMIESLDMYDSNDARFDFTAIRDNLEKSIFTQEQQEQICNDLVPPGPQRLLHLGMATINEQTVCTQDDEYILTQPCKRSFDYRALVVADLAKLAKESYGRWSQQRSTA